MWIGLKALTKTSWHYTASAFPIERPCSDIQEDCNYLYPKVFTFSKRVMPAKGFTKAPFKKDPEDEGRAATLHNVKITHQGIDS